MEIKEEVLTPLWEKYKRLVLKAARRFTTPHYELAAFDTVNKSSHPGRLYDIIEGKYRQRLSLTELARKYGVSFPLIQQEQRRAFKHLRQSKRLRCLYNDVIGRSMRRSGLGSFLHTGTSSVEWAVLKREQLQNEALEWRRDMLKRGIDINARCTKRTNIER